MKSIELSVGGVEGLPSQTCMASKRSRVAIGVELGDVIKIESPANGTTVSRRVLMAPRHADKDRFVFLNLEDIHLLHVNITDSVSVSVEPSGIECP